ncbi:carboxypeptidase-like regulatory domain-containing protein [Marinifilum fragile]|uniref:carboxypeptidase-like regulatory domain-containing protein n=1 Tax=Marinifilum fragile TaxID=570161 RepID=UPI002AA82C3E|nr:carboxypeptidase-like regulatory domain-containing protein [Marinifilum fragile]
MSFLLKCCCVLLFVFCVLHLNAQEFVVRGRVADEKTKVPLSHVLVTIRSSENKVVKYTQTDPDGKYGIKLSEFLENHKLCFSILGYASQSVVLNKEQQTYDVYMFEKATTIKEVIVKAPGIHEKGDTITYVTSSFAGVEDKSLADVLKKMPGIEIEESGKIKYNGVEINKFYIEGKDLLGGRYGLATNNVHHQDVGSVEVMENHQPIKALQDISFSQNPAINIRLKEDAKARWVGTANIGAGDGVDPFLWNAELVGMRFTSKMQTLNTYKTNNTGTNIVKETNSLSFDNRDNNFPKSYSLKDYLEVEPDYLSDIDVDRVRFNESHLISTNNLWSLGKNGDLTSQITYTNNRLESNVHSVVKYFLADSTIVNEEGESSVSHQNHLSGNVVLNANTPTYYIKNKLNADIYWDDIDMLISGTYPNTQSASTPYRSFSNDFEMIKRSENRTYTLNSYNSYQVKHQYLDVVKGDDKDRQEINSSAFYTNTNTALAFYLKPFTLSMKMGVLGVIRKMDSELTGIPNTFGQIENDLYVLNLTGYIGPELEYKNNGLEAKFNVPFSYFPYRYRDYVLDEKKSVSKFMIAPRMYLRYHFTSRLSASISASLAKKPIEEQQFYKGLLLQNYRNLSRGILNFDAGIRKSVMLSTHFKVPLKAFFANASVIRVWNTSKRIRERFFVDEFIVNGFATQESTLKMWMANGQISKGLSNPHNILSISGSYMKFRANTLQNDIETPYSSVRWDVKPKVKLRMLSWLNISYEMKYMKESLSASSTGTYSSSEMFSQVLSGNFAYKSKWYFQLLGEHYNNRLSSSNSKHLFLADAEFTYSINNRWELNFAAKNIFDEKEYNYSIYDALTRVDKEYEIRPRTIMASIFFRF